MSIKTVLTAAFIGFAALAQAEAATPGEIVRSRTEGLLETLVEQRASFAVDPTRLNEFVRTQLEAVMDREYSAQLVLGRHARGASPGQITAFADALTDSLLRRYGTALLDLDPNLDVTVKSETPLRDGQLIRVASEILRKGGAAVSVDYMFRVDSDGDWKVFDVIVEGVSYVQTFRSQFDEQLRSQTLDQVTASLRAGEIRAGG